MAKIETRTVLSEGTEPSLENSTFYIKDYQRGYRWEEQQVKSLLDDLLEFNHDNHTLKYCMQPLVVKKRNAMQWLIRVHCRNSLRRMLSKVKKLNLQIVIVRGN